MTEELIERLDVIERLVQEGRRSVERWSWAYVMWGVGHLLGVIATFTLPPQLAGIAWATLMAGCGVAMGVAGFRTDRSKQVETQTGRALSAIWWGFGFMLLFAFLAPGAGGSILSLAIFSAAYGGTFFACGHILRWLPLKLNGILWLGAGIAMKFLGGDAVLILFAAMALVGEVGFGIWAMAHERKMAGA